MPGPAAVSGSNEKPLMRLLNLGLRHSSAVFLLLSLLGYLGLLALPAFERRVKFDEKTLMLGSARVNLGARGRPIWCESGGCQGMSNEAIIGMAEGFARQVHQQQSELLHAFGPQAADGAKQSDSASTKTGRHASLLELIADFMQHKLGLEVHRSRAGGGCTSLHGILRAPLGDGKESLVIATPAALTPGAGYGDAPPAGTPLVVPAAALLLAHLQFSPYASWLAKDVVWVVPDASCGGSLAALEHWTRAYQAEPARGPAPAATGRGGNASSFGRAGVMQQAVVLLADRVDVTQLEVLVEGYDGQLPKLDMYNMLRMAAKHTTKLKVRPRAARTQPLWLLEPITKLLKTWGMESHAQKVVSLLQFASRQAMGIPTGPQAAFKEYLVDAATAKMGGRTPWPIDHLPEQLPPKAVDHITQVAEYLEAMLRSLNNLDERFHHSYFLYLLTGLDTFVTVEIYIVPLVALIAALMVKAAGLRQHLRQQEQAQQASTGPVQPCIAPAGADASTPEPARASATVAEGARHTGAALPAVHGDAYLHAQYPGSSLVGCAGFNASAQTAWSSRACLWVSAVAAVLLLQVACVGAGVGMRGMLCSCSPCLQSLLQQQQQRGPWQALGGASAWLAELWGHWPPQATLPEWAGGRQLDSHQLVILLACLSVLAANVHWGVRVIACQLLGQPQQGRQQLANGGLGSVGESRGEREPSLHSGAWEQHSGGSTNVCAASQGFQGCDGGGDGQRGVAVVGQVGGLCVPWRSTTALRVVMLSCVCMLLAAMASMNWALGYAVAGMLVPMVAARGTRKHDASMPRAVKALRAVLLLLLSPMAVAAALTALVSIDLQQGWDGHLSLAQVLEPKAMGTAFGMLTCQSSITSFVMFWAALLPCWLVDLGTLIAE